MKLLVDMNLSPRWVHLLVRAGVEAVHWSEIGLFNAPDTEIMSFAAKYEYVVLTHDLDFGTILAASHGTKPSVIQIRSEDVDPAVIGVKVLGALQQLESELKRGVLVTITPTRARLSWLPLHRNE